MAERILGIGDVSVIGGERAQESLMKKDARKITKKDRSK